MATAAFDKKKALFSSKLYLHFRKKVVKLCMLLKLGKFKKLMRNTKKVMKCGAGEEWRRSVGRIVWEMKLQRVKRDRNKLQTIKRRKDNNWFDHMWRRNCLLKHDIDGNIDGRTKWREDEEEDLSTYWITFRKRENTVNCKGNTISYSAEVAMDMSVRQTTGFFYVSLTVHPAITLGKWPTWCTITLYNVFIIIIIYMFRATLCSSSGGQIVLIQHLV